MQKGGGETRTVTYCFNLSVAQRRGDFELDDMDDRHNGRAQEPINRVGNLRDDLCVLLERYIIRTKRFQSKWFLYR